MEMGGIRIRWRGVGKVAAIAVAAVVGLSLLPGLLRAPEPPPLGADVGLPQVTPTPEEPVRPATRPRKHRQKSRPRPVPDAPASKAIIGSRHRHRIMKKRHVSHHESTAEPTPEYVPSPAPEPIAEPLPAPPPAPRSTPGDGSEEFAPH
jgi:hypothetical protein